MLGPGSAPTHPRASEAGAELLAAAFGQATPDRIVIFAPLQILHPALVLTKVAGVLAEGFGHFPFAPGMVGEGLRDLLGMAFKQDGFLCVEPLLSRGGAFPMDEVSRLA